MEDDDIFRGCGVEIRLPSDESFLTIKETLTRMGIASRKDKTLFQSCHILHKRGRYAILHFKELFILDGKSNTFSEEDKGRRNTITNLLKQWGLVEIVDEEQTKEPVSPLSQVKILPFKEKGEWNLVIKYNIGAKQ